MENRVTEFEQIMKDCTLCLRNCHADRLGGRRGYCGQGAEIMAARAALHFWEEPCISGETGSGTVFSAAVCCGAYTVRTIILRRAEPAG